MSLIISIYVPTGIVLSGDSRTTGTRSQQIPNPQQPASQITVQTNIILSDAAYKIFLLFTRFGIGTSGVAIVNNLPMAHYIEQFHSQQAPNPPQTTQDLAMSLLQYFRILQPTPQVNFIVIGYDNVDPWIIDVNVQNNTTTRININTQNQIQYGIARGGDTAIVDRLLSQPQFNPPFHLMNLQDAIDYSRHLIRTTIDQMRFEPRFATVGGYIDTLVITSERAHFLAQKSLTCS